MKTVAVAAVVDGEGAVVATVVEEEDRVIEILPFRLKAVAALIAGTRVKIFPPTEGTVKALIVAGQDARAHRMVRTGSADAE